MDSIEEYLNAKKSFRGELVNRMNDYQFIVLDRSVDKLYINMFDVSIRISISWNHCSLFKDIIGLFEQNGAYIGQPNFDRIRMSLMDKCFTIEE